MRLVRMVATVAVLAVTPAHGEAQGQPNEHYWKTMDLVKELELRPRDGIDIRNLAGTPEAVALMESIRIDLKEHQGRVAGEITNHRSFNHQSE